MGDCHGQRAHRHGSTTEQRTGDQTCRPKNGGKISNCTNTSSEFVRAGSMAAEHGLDDKELDDLLEDTLGEFSDEITARPGCFHSLRPRHESPRHESPRTCRHTYLQSGLVQPHAARAPGTDAV